MADGFCENCGQELRAGGGFCPSCGQPSRHTSQPLVQEPATPVPALQKLSRQMGTWGARRLLLLVVVVPVLLAVAWIVFQFALAVLNGFLNGLIGG